MKEVSQRQFLLLGALGLMAIKMFMLPAIVIKMSGRDGIFVIGLYAIVDAMLFFLLIWISKLCPDKTFYTTLKELLGKVVSKIVLILLSVTVLLKSVLILGEIQMFFGSSIQGSVDWPVALLMMLLLSCIIASKGFRALSRFAEIIVPLIAISTVTLFALTLSSFRVEGLLPFFERPDLIGKGIMTYPMWAGDVSLLLPFIGKFHSDKKPFLKAGIVVLVTSTVVMYFSSLFFSIYGDYTEVLDYGHNISNMALYSAGSYLYGRFDIPIFCIWLISVFVQFFLSFIGLSYHFKEIIGKGKLNYYIAATALLTAVLNLFVFASRNVLYEVCTSASIIIPYLAVMYGVPLIVLVGGISDYVKGRKKNQKNIQ